MTREELLERLLVEQFAPVPSWGRLRYGSGPADPLAIEHLVDLAYAVKAAPLDEEEEL